MLAWLLCETAPDACMWCYFQLHLRFRFFFFWDNHLRFRILTYFARPPFGPNTSAVTSGPATAQSSFFGRGQRPNLLRMRDIWQGHKAACFPQHIWGRSDHNGAIHPKKRSQRGCKYWCIDIWLIGCSWSNRRSRRKYWCIDFSCLFINFKWLIDIILNMN